MPERPADAARRLWQLWQDGSRPALSEFLAGTGPLEPLDLAGVLRVDQRQRWSLGQRIPCEDYFRDWPAVANDAEAALDLIYAEHVLRQQQGEDVSAEEFFRRFPQFADQLRLQLDFGREFGPAPPPPSSRNNELLDRFEAAWKAGRQPRIEEFLTEAPAEARLALLKKLVRAEIALRAQNQEHLDAEDYQRRFPQLTREWLDHLLGDLLSTQPPPAPTSPDDAATPTQEARGRPTVQIRGRQFRCPHCHNPMGVTDRTLDRLLCPGCGSSFRVRDAEQTSSPASLSMGKFQLLEVVGQGTFGDVWRARDAELNRIVAVKIPRQGLAISTEDLQRFVDEARKVARLRHPSIVAVHEILSVGGLPAIVSDFITGVPLKDLLDPDSPRLPFRHAARLVAEVAEALHYAHSQGLVHRDIKPANIMVESVPPADSSEEERGLGRPLILDFGLARCEEAEITATVEGQIIGTPAYMSPEQAAGRGHRADARSDVFSLGIVLYQMLCGELPFRGSRVMLLHQIQYEEPRPPRRIHDRIPADLETICLKAMAKEPARRYPTAAEFAADLRRFLNGEMIRARPVGRVERSWRWCRRHPREAALVGTVFALLIFVAAGSTTAAIHILHERNAANRAKEEADEQRRRAERNFAKLRKAMDLLTVAGQQDVPQLEHWQRELLEEVVRFYETMASEAGNDVALRAERGHAYNRVGEIRRVLGQHRPAEEAYAKAIAEFTGLRETDPAHPSYLHDLAVSHGNLAELLRTTGRPAQQAEEHYGKARELEDALSARFPDELRYRQELARTHNNRGILRQHTEGRGAEAEDDYVQAIRLLEDLNKAQPSAHEYAADLARTHINRGTLMKRTNRLWGAEQEYLTAIRLLREVVSLQAVPPDHRYTLREYRYRLGVTCVNLGNLLEQSKGRERDREKALGEAIGIFTKLQAEYPGILLYRKELGNSYNSLGNLLADTGQTGALSKYQQAEAVFEQLVGECPDIPEYRYHLGMALNNISVLLLEWQKLEEGRHLLLLTTPDCCPRIGLPPTAWALGVHNRGRLIESQAALAKAIDALEAASQAARGNRTYREELRNAYWNVAETCARIGDAEKAAAAARRLPACLPNEWPEYRRAAAYLVRCAIVVEGQSGTLAERSQRVDRLEREAIQLLREGLRHVQRKVEDLKTDPAFARLKARREFQELLEQLPQPKPLS